MHNSVDSVNVVPQHETCHGVGWKRESLIRAIQAPWKPIINYFFRFNILLVILRYIVLTVNRSLNRHFTMVYHPWRPQRSQFENIWKPLKLMLICSSGVVFFPLMVSRYSSDHLPTTPRCNGNFGHWTEPQRPRFFFIAPTRLWCLDVLRARNTGMHQV